ncbi:hypothetical protein [Catenulispora rubra]|uniref:hypothetical protein n=1 Tax=Catenulispora rubra TaxID=280293 RepID=UPI001891F965|nr:hypothetical protein [Catenulispora rubra]
MSPEPVTLRYAFACVQCEHAWEEEFEIRQTRGADGLIQAFYFQHGVRARSPLVQDECPRCDAPGIGVRRRRRPVTRRRTG